MKFAYQFSQQCGTVYKCGNVVFTHDGNCLLSPVGNRVTVFDLVENATYTLPFENRKNIERIALSGGSRLLVSVDEDGRALLVNFRRRIVLHRFNFKARVRDIQFSPDDKYIAVTHGRHLQVWRAPGLRREFSPFVLHRTYTGHTGDVTCVDWSPNSKYLVTGSKDLHARIYSLDPVDGFVPVTLMGHRDALVGVSFAANDTIYTVSRDAALMVWQWRERALPGGDKQQKKDKKKFKSTAMLASRVHHTVPNPAAAGAAAGAGAGAAAGAGAGGSSTALVVHNGGSGDRELNLSIQHGEWGRESKHFFKQDHATVHSAAVHKGNKLLVLGFSSGVFGLYELPGCLQIHTLSVSQRRIQAAAINPSGDWLAFGSATLGQLLVWEWQSETYILKQQGHFYALNALAYSPDGQSMVTGGDDGKVKVWSTSTGFCFVTFKDHSAAVTDLAFIGGKTSAGSAVVTASLDGTVRAYDLVRYRNFRTMTTPTPVQFLSLAVDASGELVCAGTLEPFEIYVWSLQTGKLLDVLAGHEGPIASLAFHPAGSMLASGSWDRTVRLWDVFNTGTATETLQHDSDILAVAFRPDGKELCASTRSGKLCFWDSASGVARGVIDGRRDAAGGRRVGDARTSKSSAAGKCFSSVCYTADGECVLAGGRTKYVCIYAVHPALLLKKFQLSHNRSLDGVLDLLSGRTMTEAGDVAELALSGSDDERTGDAALPGVVRGDLSSRKTRPEIRTSCVRFSPTGRAWAAATTEGLLVYSLDDSLVFDPFELDEDVTPATVRSAIAAEKFARALLLALHLNEVDVLREALQAVPAASIPIVSSGVPTVFLPRLLRFVAERMTESPHLEYYLRWTLALVQDHGRLIRQRPDQMLPSLRSLQRAILKHKGALSKICATNLHSMRFLCAVPWSSADTTPATATKAGAAAGAATGTGGGAGGGAGAGAGAGAAADADVAMSDGGGASETKATKGQQKPKKGKKKKSKKKQKKGQEQGGASGGLFAQALAGVDSGIFAGSS